jgi:hypothetical protein
LLTAGPIIAPRESEAGSVPIVCPSDDQAQLLKNYLSIRKNKRTKEDGEKLLAVLECIQKTKGLVPSHELFHALLKWASIHEQNALRAIRLIRDLALSKDLSPWMQGHMLLAGLPGGGYDLMGRLGMVLMYWKRSESSSGIIDAFTDIAKTYPSKDEFTGRFHPVGKEIPLYRARLLARWGPAKAVPDAMKTLTQDLKDRKKKIRAMAASILSDIYIDSIAILNPHLWPVYGISLLPMGDPISKHGRKYDGKESRAIAQSIVSACNRKGVMRRIMRNLQGEEREIEGSALRQIQRALKSERKYKRVETYLKELESENRK